MRPRRCRARACSCRAQLSIAGDDEYYWVDLIGLAVVNRQGEALGTVIGLLDTGAHSVLCVRRSEPPGDADSRSRAPDPVRRRLRRRGRPGRRGASWSTGGWTTEPREPGHALRRHHAVSRTVRAAPDAGHHAARVRERARSTCGCGRCATLPTDTYRRVDDRPFGGGPGMVMLAEPLERALARRARATDAERRRRWCTSRPPARRSTRRVVRELAARRRARCCCAAATKASTSAFIDRHVDSRDQPGRLRAVGRRIAGAGAARCRGAPAARRADRRASHQQDSFSDGLLDGPHYSRPEVLATPTGPLPVPPVLLSGHHAADRALAARAGAGS